MKKNVAVIGGGLGGLSAAIRLANKGYNVDLYEKNNSLGGKANQIKTEGYRFDTGPSLMTMPFVVEELFSSCGEDIKNYLTFRKLDLLCRYFYSDGTVFNAYHDKEKFFNEVETKTKDKKETLVKFYKYCSDIYKYTSDTFLFNDNISLKYLFTKSSFLALLNLHKIDLRRTMNEAVSSFFKDEKLIQLFNRYATYNGSNPYQIPATFNIITHVENSIGGGYIEGGMYELVKALEKLAVKKGVNIFLNSDVKQINIKNKKVKSVNVNNHEKNYDIIVSNSDVLNTYENLLRNTDLPVAKKYKKLEPSTSAVVFYWGVKKITDKPDIHNIIFADDYKKEFEYLFNKKICSDDLTIYIYISSKFSKSDAPDGFENWFVMVNAPYDSGQNWTEEVKKIRANIIKKINTTFDIDLENNIVFERTMNPNDMKEKTSSTKGSIYGISSNDKMAAFFRQTNKSKEIKGLYFCGGSAHPGGGIPLVILSGKKAADLISKYEK
jgi:phytoene desaturase